MAGLVQQYAHNQRYHHAHRHNTDIYHPVRTNSRVKHASDTGSKTVGNLAGIVHQFTSKKKTFIHGFVRI
ncbi:hypothetical protein DMH17_09620 [Raoultella planticola]|nr:hypothetical protein [Raoultella planticola]